MAGTLKQISIEWASEHGLTWLQARWQLLTGDYNANKDYIYITLQLIRLSDYISIKSNV